jgi:predicted RNase H-like HicB family nuclease
MHEYMYMVIFETDLDDGGWVATVPALQLATQGESLPETRRMVREAIAGYIQGLRAEGLPIPREPRRLVRQIRAERIAIKA